MSGRDSQPTAFSSKQRTVLEELVRTATEVHRISHRTHEAWIALAAALSEARAVMTQPDETNGDVAKLHGVIQTVMSRLADLLDSDQFNNIEAIVLEAGVPYPPEKTSCSDPHGDTPVESA